jgi:predicted membrane metal-binding protein
MSHTPKRKPPGLVRRTLRIVAAHAILQLVAPQFWHALALVAIAGMLAIPSSVLESSSWLRAALPIALAIVGTAVHGCHQHPAAKARTVK